MQNNVTELTNRLLRALDNNYNVIDMPAVIEIVSLLEKVTITKELLETTRLGKHVNELRRKTDNDSLSKRAKELVKKWRNMVLPDSTNGQLKQTDTQIIDSKKRPLTKSPPISVDIKRAKLNGTSNELDMSDNSNSSFKDVINSSANSAAKLLLMKQQHQRNDVILINSDSNSSFPDIKTEPVLEQQQPKKRGRKKGSKNHKNLLDEAETSFTNKLAVSRGNSKVKTTQELIAGLQNKNNSNSLGQSPIKPKEDLNIRAAKLTERVSIIDQKLNTNANRYKNSQKKNLQQTKIHIGEKSDRIIESGSVINDKSLLIQQQQQQNEEEVIVVDDVEPPIKFERDETEEQEERVDEEIVDDGKIKSLSVEEALAQLPPIDKNVLDCYNDPICTCLLKECEKNNDEEDNSEIIGLKCYEFVEDSECDARLNLIKRIDENAITPKDLHTKYLENINGNWGVVLDNKNRSDIIDTNHVIDVNGLYVNVVPNVNIERIPKDVKCCGFSCENYKKYNVSEDYVEDESMLCDKNDVNRTDSEFVVKSCSEIKVNENNDNQEEEEEEKDKDNDENNKVFREWHEVLDKPSYNGEILKILPYVIID